MPSRNTHYEGITFEGITETEACFPEITISAKKHHKTHLPVFRLASARSDGCFFLFFSLCVLKKKISRAPRKAANIQCVENDER